MTELAAQELRAFLLAAVSRIQVQAESIEISLDASALIHWLSDEGLGQTTMPRTAPEHLVTLTIPARLKRTGLEMRLVIQGETSEDPDPSLTRIMVRAHAIRDRLFQDGNLTVEEVARQEDIVPSYDTRLLRLTFLAPDITARILAGRQPPDLTARKLMADTRLPLDWNEQRSQLGFA